MAGISRNWAKQTRTDVTRSFKIGSNGRGGTTDVCFHREGWWMSRSLSLLVFLKGAIPLSCFHWSDTSDDWRACLHKSRVELLARRAVTS